MSQAPKAEGVIPEFKHFTTKVHHEPYEKISPLRPELSARGKNIVVTGGGTGIGKAIAVEFARAGAHAVCILGRREDRLVTATKEIAAAARDTLSEVLYEVTDLNKPEEVHNAFQSFVRKVGKIDILVSNAGVLAALGKVEAYDGEELMRAYQNNVISALNAVRAFLASSAPDPMIINISSGIAHIDPIPAFVAHGSSKAAALKMMDYLAAENPQLHVVNLQPGGVSTEMSAQIGISGIDAGESNMNPRFPFRSLIPISQRSCPVSSVYGSHRQRPHF